MAQVHAYDFLVTGSQYPRDRVLLGRKANQITSFYYVRKNQAKSMKNINKKKRKKTTTTTTTANSCSK
jgi:hypothetical protein